MKSMINHWFIVEIWNKTMSDTIKMIDVLTKSIKIFQRKKDSWCQGQLAKSETGSGVSPLSDEAVSFCSVGVLIKILSKKGDAFYQIAYLESRIEFEIISTVKEQERWWLSISAWNDDCYRTKKEVIAVFKRTIERLSKDV